MPKQSLRMGMPGTEMERDTRLRESLGGEAKCRECSATTAFSNLGLPVLKGQSGKAGLSRRQ